MSLSSRRFRRDVARGQHLARILMKNRQALWNNSCGESVCHQVMSFSSFGNSRFMGTSAGETDTSQSDPWTILGVEKGSSVDEIKKAYRSWQSPACHDVVLNVLFLIWLSGLYNLTASRLVLKQIFFNRRLAKLHHPDLHAGCKDKSAAAEKEFKRIHAAYALLTGRGK